jgi:hypothetical protein
MIDMRRTLTLICGVFIALLIPASANATISSVFDGALSCTTDGTSNFRYCGTTPGTMIPSWDGTPIDVSVSFPVATGGDNNYSLVGVFPGWAGSKQLPSNSNTNVTRWLARGYAVISVTNRGWQASCGGPNYGTNQKAPPCSKGYIHLMHNAYEVRDAQYLMGLLADDGVINPTKIAPTGGSYGGGISAQMAVLKNRVQHTDGTLHPWQSPDGANLSVAAALPDYTWSNLPQSLMPNGSNLDYAKYSPYLGPNGDHRPGINKQYWSGQLYLAAFLAGYLAPTSGAGYPDPTANMVGWFDQLGTGGPYTNNQTITQMIDELSTNHGSLGVANNAPPAPMLIGNGWNDDLFPVSEGVRLYNKIRADYPTTPVKLIELDYGHTPRAANFAGDFGQLIAQQNAWLDHYMGGGTIADPGVPADQLGGVSIVTSKCSGTARVAGDYFTAANWNSLTPGEIQVNGAASQTIQVGTTPASAFVSGTVCANSAAGVADTAGAAVYESVTATGSGFTVAGSPTVIATINATNSNDQIISRLYDVDTGASTEKLIARGTYRPVKYGVGAHEETFQLYPQGWTVASGHKLKLELLSSDSPYTQTAGSSTQHPITVSNLRMNVPVIEVPTSMGGEVKARSTRKLPAGYEFTDDVLTADTIDPETTDDVTTALATAPVPVTLTGTDEGGTDVEKTYYTVGANPATPTAASAVYNPAAKPTLNNGEKISYFSVDYAGNVENGINTSVAAQVAIPVPITPIVPVPPTLVVTPKVKGTVKVGKTITASATSKADGVSVSNVKYSYKWKNGDKTLGKSSKLKLKSSWAGKKIKLVVTATKDGYKTGTKTVTVTKKLKK